MLENTGLRPKKGEKTMESEENRDRRYIEKRFDEIQSGMIAALRASGELASSGKVTFSERQQLRKLNNQIKFYLYKVGTMKGETDGSGNAAQTE